MDTRVNPQELARLGIELERPTVRPLRIRDWPALARLMPAIFPELSARQVSDFLVGAVHVMGVALIGGMLVGFYQFHRIGTSRTAWLNYIGVSEMTRSNGVGGRLLADVEQRAGAMGMTRVELDVLLHNVDAQRFYERHGYQRLEVHSEAIRPKVRYGKAIAASEVDIGRQAGSGSGRLLREAFRRVVYGVLVELPAHWSFRTRSGPPSSHG